LKRSVDRAGARELDLLAGAPQSVLEQLAKSLEERHVDTGTVLIRQGDPSDALWVVVDGTIKVTVTTSTGETDMLRTQGPSTYVGEIGLLHATRRTATVTTTSSSLLWRISAGDFSEALEDSAPSPTLLSVVGRRLAHSHSTARTTGPV
jgi:CRP-like cAMP-binding protein